MTPKQKHADKILANSDVYGVVGFAIYTKFKVGNGYALDLSAIKGNLVGDVNGATTSPSRSVFIGFFPIRGVVSRPNRGRSRVANIYP